MCCTWTGSNALPMTGENREPANFAPPGGKRLVTICCTRKADSTETRTKSIRDWQMQHVEGHCWEIQFGLWCVFMLLPLVASVYVISNSPCIYGKRQDYNIRMDRDT